MEDKRLRFWLSLYFAQTIGYQDKLKLAKSAPRFNMEPDQLLHQLAETADLSLRQRHQLSAKVESTMDQLISTQIQLIGYGDADYPKLLQHITTPPLVLFVIGNVDYLHTPQIAVVGSRKATPTGLRAAYELALDLSSVGFTITSGMALGIDAQSHRAALDNQACTIAVLGAGIDQIYPRQHRKLYHKIADQGAIVSEYPPAIPPRRGQFPERNRIIAGLTLGVLVAEANFKSGSLITARLSGEYGREVFAIPGSIYSPTSRGCHQLLRQGVKLVENITDIIEELPQFFTKNSQNDDVKPQKPAKTELKTTPLTKPVYELIDYTPRSIDELCRLADRSLAEIAPVLLELELEGYIVEISGAYQRT